MSVLEEGAGHGETVRFVSTQPEEGEYVLALLKKRTYSLLRDGSCVIAEEQRPITEDVVYEEEPESPEVAAPRWDNDRFALKPLTDLVVQGQARSYRGPTRETYVEVRVADVVRQMRVRGDRICEWSGSGPPVFSPPEPFETMPVRYERAYGGFDREMLTREGDAFADAFRRVRPEWKADAATRFHYPRNPAGIGYTVHAASRERPVPVPNLDYPFDPVSPERMAVPSVERWLCAPLPAALDWCDQTWFPRSGYLGFTPPHAEEDVPPGEVRYGFAAGDVLESPSILDLEFRWEFLQGASAGLSFQDLAPGTEILVRNMFEDAPDFIARLPPRRPRLAVEPRGQARQEMEEMPYWIGW